MQPSSSKYPEEWAESVLRDDDEFVEALQHLGYSKMTPVQAVCIPLISVDRKDVAVEAVTGSGKTLAFVIPLLMWFRKRKEIVFVDGQISALVLVPTRELAVQVKETFESLLTELLMSQLEVRAFIGGTKVDEDIKTFQKNGSHIVIATPGRFEELIKRDCSTFTICKALKSLEYLILDEADRLLDLGFENSINFILDYLPKQRRTALFSATQTSDLNSLRRAGLRNPACITVKQASAIDCSRVPSSLQNYYMVVDFDAKFNTLMKILDCCEGIAKGKCILFFNTCHCVNYFANVLIRLLPDREIFVMHKKVRKRRARVYSSFIHCKTNNPILVCTDLMSRGVDIPKVDWVIQFDLPNRLNAFIHRCGRTARLGQIGNALCFLMPNELAFVNFVEKCQKVKLCQLHTPSPIPEYSDELKKLALEEREFLENGKSAFVSFIQAYSSHECSLLFRVKELDIAKIAISYGLLELPQMKEINADRFSNFNNQTIDLSSIKFKDPMREKRRQKKIGIENTLSKNNMEQKAFSKRKNRSLKKKLKRLKRLSKNEKLM